MTLAFYYIQKDHMLRHKKFGYICIDLTFSYWYTLFIVFNHHNLFRITIIDFN